MGITARRLEVQYGMAVLPVDFLLHRHSNSKWVLLKVIGRNKSACSTTELSNRPIIFIKKGDS